MKRPHFELEFLLSNAWFQWTLVVLGLFYFASMFFIPAILTAGAWSELQKVWDRWQSLNVGVLAFAASYLALQIARVNIADRSRRDFIAARAFLPKALSDLATYCANHAQLLLDIHAELSNEAQDSSSASPTRGLPELPPEVYQTLEKCIRTAPTETARFLAAFLSGLQVVEARSRSLIPRSSGFSVSPLHSHRTAESYLANVAVLRVQVDLMFPFARFEEESMPTELDINREVDTVLKTLEVPPTLTTQLEEEITNGLRYFADKRGLTVILKN